MINQEAFSIVSNILYKLINDAKKIQLNNLQIIVFNKNINSFCNSNLTLAYNEFSIHEENIKKFMNNFFTLIAQHTDARFNKDIIELFRIININDILQTLRKIVFANVDNPNRLIEKLKEEFEECPKSYNSLLLDIFIDKLLETPLTRKDDTILTDTEQNYAFSFDDSFDNAKNDNLIVTKRLSIYKKPLINGYCYKNVHASFGFNQKTINVKTLTFKNTNFHNFIRYEKTDLNRSNFSYD